MFKAGFYPDIPADIYHADPCERPSLSSGLAKLFINETPLHVFRAHPRLNPAYRKSDPTPQMERGTNIHTVLLGKGKTFSVLDFDDFRKKEAREARQSALAAGDQPILKKDYEALLDIPEAVHPALFSLGIDLIKTTNESVVVWQEGEQFCRIMIDAMDPTGIIYDLKTHSGSMSDKALGRTIANYLYDFQAAFYLRGIENVFPEMAGRLKFRWIFVSPDAPYDVRVIEATNAQLDMAGRMVDRAISQWASCMASNEWPGYPNAITSVDLPAWYEAGIIEMEMAD